MQESGFENYVMKKIRSVGGRAFKWVCPGMTGAPDRICIFPGGRIIFIELKRPGLSDGRSERQKKVCRLLRGRTRGQADVPYHQRPVRCGDRDLRPAEGDGDIRTAG